MFSFSKSSNKIINLEGEEWFGYFSWFWSEHSQRSKAKERGGQSYFGNATRMPSFYKNIHPYGDIKSLGHWGEKIT